MDVCAPPRDRGGPSLAPPQGSVGGVTPPPVPFLAQEVFEVVHELLRVEVGVTRWAWRRGTHRVIGLLELPHIGLGRGILGHRLVAARPKGLHRRIEVGHLQLQVEQTRDRSQEGLAHSRIGRVPQVMGRLPPHGERGEPPARRRVPDDRRNPGRAFIVRATCPDPTRC